jgi:hypothetical protein
MSFHRFAWHLAGLTLSAFWWVAPSIGSAQGTDPEYGELAALGGGAFGIGAQPAVTGGAGIAFSRYGMGLLETSFMPMGQRTIGSLPSRSPVIRSYLYDFALNFHVRIPVGERWEPYGILGTGLLWNPIRQQTFNSQGVSIVKHYDQFGGAFHTGGGLRYHIAPNWGIRPEVKVIVGKQTYAQVMLGIFYVTPAE